MYYEKTALWLVILTAVVFAAPAARAQKVTFEPSLEFGQGYTDNIGLGDGATSSDSILTLRAVLPVVRGWRTGQVDFRYEPSLSRYDQADRLDRDEHKLALAFRAEPQRGTKYRLATRFRSSQTQGESVSTEDPDLFLARRTDRQIASLDFHTETPLSARWLWKVSLGGTLFDYNAIDDPDNTEDLSPSSSVEDRTEVRGSVRFARSVRGSGSSLGFEVAHSEFDLDESPDAASDTIRFVYSRRLGRHTNVNLALGAYQVDSKPQDPLPGQAVVEAQDTSGVDFSASLTRRFRKMLLTLTGRNAPSSGGALRGASTNSLLGLSLGTSEDPLWSWRLSPRIAERDPNDNQAATRRTVSIGGQIGRRITREIRLRLRANHVQQSGTDDRDVLTAEFAVQWFPRGGARISR